MKTTAKKIKSFINLVQLAGSDPNGKPTTLCDQFNIGVTANSARVVTMDKTQKMYIDVAMEVEATDISTIPIIVEDYIGKGSKLGRFADADILSITLEGNTTKISREKPKKTFTMNNPATPIAQFDSSLYNFVFTPEGLTLNGDPFNIVIKTTAEAMLDIIEDAKPFYEKIQDLVFPLTISNDTVKLEIGNKTIGSVESELQATSISTPIQKKYTFGPGFHNIFANLAGAVTLYFGEVKGATKLNPAMIVVWNNGAFAATYILRGYS